MKAPEKDRARRYASSAELAADIQRYLQDESVEARPPTVGYRTKKFVRRHRLGVTAAGIVVVSLVGAVVGQATRRPIPRRRHPVEPEHHLQQVGRFRSRVRGGGLPFGLETVPAGRRVGGV